MKKSLFLKLPLLVIFTKEFIFCNRQLSFNIDFINYFLCNNQSGEFYGMVLLIILTFSMLTGIINWVENYDSIICENGNNRKQLFVSFSKTKEGLD
jgi:hypothetical protein